MSSVKLRQLIRAIRACKTAAEERKVVANECAIIRTAFKDNDESSRARNLAKLLFIHMLGYPSHFGQMESIKLLTSSEFGDKRIGYLGLTLLLQEKDEVLMLATNSLKVDLNSENKFVVGLALAAIGNLATPDMARDLMMEVDKHLRGDNSYLRKKAALTTIRVLKKCPELVDDFAERVGSLLKDRSHGVVIAGMRLMITVIELDPEQALGFTHLVPSLVRMLKHLLTSGYTAEHDVAGITDPFLQVTLLRLVRMLAQYSEGASEQMNDILTQVATTTETAKNAGNSILYECVRTILSVESEQGLSLLAVNILGRFLTNRDNNMRYVALNSLCQVVSRDMASVQRHRSTIVECLKDPDVSIRLRATHLIFELINESNVESLMQELLNYLAVVSADQRNDLCSNIMTVVEKYAPTKRWRVDTLLTMLSLTRDECDESVSATTVIYITQAPELHAYGAHKTFRLMQADLSHKSLTMVGTWCLGEYGEMLLSPCQAPEGRGGILAAEEHDLFTAAIGASPSILGGLSNTGSYTAVPDTAIVDVMEKIMVGHASTESMKGYVLTALVKLQPKLSPFIAMGAAAAVSIDGSPVSFEQQQQQAALSQRIEALISICKESISLELQSRSCEYSLLLGPSLASIRPQILDKMPVMHESVLALRSRRLKSKKLKDTLEDSDDDEGGGGGDKAAKKELVISPRSPRSSRRARGGGIGGTATTASIGGLNTGSSFNGTGNFAGFGTVNSAAGAVGINGGGGGGGSGSGGGLAGEAPAETRLLDLDDLFGTRTALDDGPTPLSSDIIGGGGGGVAGGGGGGGGSGGGLTAPPGQVFPAALNGGAVAPGLADIFSAQAQQQPPIPPVIPDNIFPPTPILPPAVPTTTTTPTTTTLSSPPTSAPFTVFNKDGLLVTFTLAKIIPPGGDEQAGGCRVFVTFTNTTVNDMTALHFQAAVPKYVKLDMMAASSSVIPANGASQTRQMVQLLNTLHGSKPVMMKMKIDYQVAGKAVSEIAQVSSFPPGF